MKSMASEYGFFTRLPGGSLSEHHGFVGFLDLGVISIPVKGDPSSDGGDDRPDPNFAYLPFQLFQ